VGNRDDHLRNHGFILEQGDWRLAPSFDLNPSNDKAEHVLAIDDSDPRPSLETVLSTAAFYGLSGQVAREIIEEVISVVGDWRDLAKSVGLSAAERELMVGAFSAHAEFYQKIHTTT